MCLIDGELSVSGRTERAGQGRWSPVKGQAGQCYATTGAAVEQETIDSLTSGIHRLMSRKD